MSGDKKWACEYCTYENWPSANKCTLCRGPKLPQLIAEEATRQDHDIYNLSPLIPSTTVDNKSGNGMQNLINRDSTATNPFQKWTCSGCTYLNWPRAIKCAQCLVVRKKSSTLTATSAPQQDNSIVDHQSSRINANQESPSNSPTELSPHTNEENQIYNRISTSYPTKWVCSACTYENWPKSLKCVICRTSRLISPVSDPTSPTSDFRGYEKEERKLASSSADDNRVIERASGSTSQLNSSSISLPAAHNRERLSPRALNDQNEALILPSIAGASANNYEKEKRLKQLRKCMQEADWSWLSACLGVVDGDVNPVETYLSTGGDPARQLTHSEVNLLGRPSAFDTGHTLVHLAIRFQREDLLRLLLSSDIAHGAKKWAPSHVSPDLAAEIRRHIASALLHRKGDFPCIFVTELVTFALPPEIEDFAPTVQEQLLDELLDRDVQKELEVESPIINWSLELTERLGSRLYPLWNRTAGDCLLDSVLQATWGVFDKENTLRRALSDSLSEGSSAWKEAEAVQAHLLHFTLDEAQWQQDWAILLSLASQPGAPLEQMHIFALAHILRRPIIVYGVKYVKSFRGEAIGFARFEGVYLPLLWEQNFCWKTPISLGYTRGHFCALVPTEPDSSDNLGAGANIHASDDLQVIFLPLMTSDFKLLPVHFLTDLEIGQEEHILRQWLDCCVTEGGLLVAQQKIQKRPLLVAQLIEEWLNHYRRLNEIPPISSRRSPSAINPGYLSDGDSEDD
uniref:ubiquitinyl hydrolase 1 n=1 Tax=Strigamia maritima TaxID=126957 RepID=T1IIP4_STRMM